MKRIISSVFFLTIMSFGIITVMNVVEVKGDDFLIPVSSAVSVAIYEKTVETSEYDFTVADVFDEGAIFITNAAEHYTITSDGIYLQIHCYRDAHGSGAEVGDNIVAVKLDGVENFPQGIWATTVVNYTVGYNGIAESRFNALGPANQTGPYGSYQWTLMGDQHSELVLGFTVEMVPPPPPPETPIPLSLGTSVTVYEQTETIQSHTFLTSNLLVSGGVFSTSAKEDYSLTSDGTYLRIHCFRNAFSSGIGVANNIVAVRLDGVVDFPEGIWATTIEVYVVGYRGIADSRFNALGSATQVGPFGRYLGTFMGDQHSELVLGFTVNGTPLPPPPLPEFPLDSALFIAVIPMLFYLWRKGKHKLL